MLRFRQVLTVTLTLLLCGTAQAQSSGEMIHQALTRGAQPPLHPSASFLASCGDLFFSAHDGSTYLPTNFGEGPSCPKVDLLMSPKCGEREGVAGRVGFKVIGWLKLVEMSLGGGDGWMWMKTAWRCLAAGPTLLVAVESCLKTDEVNCALLNSIYQDGTRQC